MITYNNFLYYVYNDVISTNFFMFPDFAISNFSALIELSINFYNSGSVLNLLITFYGVLLTNS